MFLLGLLLALIGLALGTALFLGSGGAQVVPPREIDLSFESIDQVVKVSPVQLLVAGGIAVLLVWLGWSIMAAALARGSRRRAERREAAREAKKERERLEAEQAEQERVAKARLRDERIATETARRRAEVAEAERDAARAESPPPKAPETDQPTNGDARASASPSTQPAASDGGGLVSRMADKARGVIDRSDD